ncbi:MAG: hypothetical protein R2828_28645 [Saprospiraceae bacterium]
MKFCLPILMIAVMSMMACNQGANVSEKAPETSLTPGADTSLFPAELVDFQAGTENPVFTGTGEDTWDQQIRERGFILKEEGRYHMWYTGFKKGGQLLSLGYATSMDGISWTRYNDKPIFEENWTEDMMVLKVDGTYQMFAEGKDDIAHRLTSTDRIHWTDHGSLDIRLVNGEPLSEGPYGTPTVWFEDNTWYLFYERNDLGIWLATSDDLAVWTNVQDDPVIQMGPEAYDKYGLAVNQIIKYKGWYYAYYHGTAFEDWREWSTNVAASKDLIHWEKYKGNPILGENKSSGILVADGAPFRLYTMHNEVVVHFPRQSVN